MNVILADILPLLENPEISGNSVAPISGVTHDSRRVCLDFAFVAMVGEKVDGHDFVSKACKGGASVIIAEKDPPTGFDTSKVTWVRVQNSRRALGPIAACVYDRPSESMSLVGITGTNGKTTTTYLLESILRAAQFVPGIIGTISHRWPGVEIAASNTTPEASDIQKMLAEMRQIGVTHVLMEVSSHGLCMRRLDGCNFDAGVFTNLTHDHLDFHLNMEAYYAAKKILFDELLPSSNKRGVYAAINIDDHYGSRLIREISSVPIIKYGLTNKADVYPVNTQISPKGVKADILTPDGPLSVESELVGAFNLSNIMAAVSVSLKLGISREAITTGIKSVKAVPGRLERVVSGSGAIFVDYAHTPNALKNVLQAIRDICQGRLITLMGCGGDRDRTKRPVMGMEAASGSDFVVITSDNPRSEDPIAIIKQIEEGVLKFGFQKISLDSANSVMKKGTYVVISDRRQAIEWAIRKLEPTDTLLLAGKGHETYQEINGIRYPFDDRVIALKESKKLSSSNHKNQNTERPLQTIRA